MFRWYTESRGAQPKQNHGIIDTYGQSATYTDWGIIRHKGDNIPRYTANTGNASFQLPDNPPTNMDTGTAVPYGAFRNLKANNSAAQNVTAFSNLVNGQRLTIRGDGFTTLLNGATSPQHQGQICFWPLAFGISSSSREAF